MTGTILNVAAVLVGGLLGLVMGSRVPERVRRTVVSGLGLFVLAWAVQMFTKTSNALIVLGAILIGGILGEFAGIEDRLESLGILLEKRFARPAEGEQTGANSRFVRGFMTASLIFCIGPMAILGSIQDGLSGDFSVLAVKSVLDGFAALAFASTLGVGVLFSSLPVLVYQGAISLGAAQVNSIVSDTMMAEMTAAGGVILMGISISSLLELKKIRVGNFLPALLIAPLIVWIITLFP